MSRAILVNFHKYTPFGNEFYEPLLDFFLSNMRKFADEYDMLYLLDSNWNIDQAKLKGLKATVIRTDPNMRYYDCFKEVIPGMKEDLILLLDDDMVVYKEGVIRNIFYRLGSNQPLPPIIKGITWITYDVDTIFDTIGTFKTDKMNGKNKFCPYMFATRKEILMRYLDVNWASDMPYCETLGHLTEVMLNDNVDVHEQPEDKSNCLFSGSQDGEKGKDLGYYHIRAGSTPAYLLASREYPGQEEVYQQYITNQPKDEYLRQFAWYWYMLSRSGSLQDLRNILPGFEAVLKDVGIDYDTEWREYMVRFIDYHGLP